MLQLRTRHDSTLSPGHGQTSIQTMHSANPSGRKFFNVNARMRGQEQQSLHCRFSCCMQPGMRQGRDACMYAGTSTMRLGKCSRPVGAAMPYITLSAFSTIEVSVSCPKVCT